MRAATRATALVLALALVTVGLTTVDTRSTATAAEPAAAEPAFEASWVSPPASVAVLGDSISQGTGANGGGQDGFPGQSRTRNSWATGDWWDLNSNWQRIDALTWTPVQRHNLSRNGARVAVDLVAQAQQLPVGIEYVLILMGGNDLCRPSVGEMTSVAVYDAEVNAALSWISAHRPTALVGVVSVPDIYRLWEIRRTNFWAVLFWASGLIPCQSLLANPTSTSPANMARRAAVRQRGLEYNNVLRNRCNQHARCLYDNDWLWLRTNNPSTFVDADISTQDHFHPSYQGQKKVAQFTWESLYSFSYWSSPTATSDTSAATAGSPALSVHATATRSLPSRSALPDSDPPLPTEWRAAATITHLSAEDARTEAQRTVPQEAAARWQDRYLAAVRQAVPTTAQVDDALLLDWPVTLCTVLDEHDVRPDEVAEGLADYGVDAAVAGYVTGAAVAAACPAHTR